MVSVLLIDDDSITNLISVKLISRALPDTMINICLNGKEAIDLLLNMRKKVPSAYPDYILLDLNMPLMNGWEFLDEYICVNLDPDANCRIFILSSSVSSTDMNKAHNYAVVSDFVSKPLDAQKIRKLFMSEMSA